MAIVSFQNASKIDSEQQLPRDKVVEINKIMDENSSNGLSNNQSILNSYSLLYGQEVTGKYSEDQVEVIMGTKSQVEVEMDEMNSEFKKDIENHNFPSEEYSYDMGSDIQDSLKEWKKEIKKILS